MTPETQQIPEWARQDREADLDWVEENLILFWSAAILAFQDIGRGAIVVDTTVRPTPDAGHPFAYFLHQQLEEAGNEDTVRMVKEYDPDQELVLVLLKPGDRTSVYRIRAFPDSQENATSKPTQTHAGEVKLVPPDLETLMEWEAEGGCEAACPHRCWVEPDGTCPHGNPSWLLKLGLI